MNIPLISLTQQLDFESDSLRSFFFFDRIIGRARNLFSISNEEDWFQFSAFRLCLLQEAEKILPHS